MKRLIASILVLVLAFGVACSVAEEDKSAKDEYFKNISMMDLYYDLLPDDFGADKIMYTYLNFVMYMNAEMYDMFSIAYALKDRYDGDIIGRVKPLATSSAQVAKIATDGYLDWLNGIISDAEYAKNLMEVVSSVVDNKNK